MEKLYGELTMCIIIIFEIFEHTKNHGKKLLKLSQISFGGINKFKAKF